MATNLPTDLLRTFVAIADTGSMAKASGKIFRTQSALSLQMKRLEELVQTPLFRREGRNLCLTPAGDMLLSSAREILSINDRAVNSLTDDQLDGSARIGLIPDFAETLLPSVLARFARLNPKAQIRVWVGNSYELKTMLANDQLDITVGLSDPSDPMTIHVADLVWIGDPALIGEPVIPLALLDPPCRCRDACMEALERAGLNFRVMLETPSLSVLAGSVKAGLAITCRPTSNMRLNSESSPMRVSGIELPKIGYALHHKASGGRSIERLVELLTEAIRRL